MKIDKQTEETMKRACVNAVNAYFDTLGITDQAKYSFMLSGLMGHVLREYQTNCGLDMTKDIINGMILCVEVSIHKPN